MYASDANFMMLVQDTAAAGRINGETCLGVVRPGPHQQYGSISHPAEFASLAGLPPHEAAHAHDATTAGTLVAKKEGRCVPC